MQAKGLFQGVRLTVFAPSRQWMTSQGEVDYALHEKALCALETLGFELRLTGSVWLEDRRFAGTDRERAADFVTALNLEGSDLLMALRGGWGAARMLSCLDWEAIPGEIPPLVGYSDITAINLALLARKNIVSWQGPTLRDLIDPDPLTLEGLEMVLGRRPFSLSWPARRFFGSERGEVSGVLWGGNLSVLTSLIGTPYFPSGVLASDNILFLEDVSESAYRIDRMLMQLELTGALRHTKAIVAGEFTGADQSCGWDGDFELFDALQDTAERSGVPVIDGLPFGHVHAKTSLPVGERVRLVYSGGGVTLERR